MHDLAGPYLALAVLLVAAGAGKLLDPSPLVRALRSAGLPAAPLLVRAGAGAEVAVGGTAAATGARLPALLVSLSYVAFTAFVLLARSRGGVLASCGCFGRVDTPATTGHAVLTAAAAAVAATVAVRPLGPLPGVLAGTPGAGVPLLLATAAVAATAYLALALLPLLQVAR